MLRRWTPIKATANSSCVQNARFVKEQIRKVLPWPLSASIGAKSAFIGGEENDTSTGAAFRPISAKTPRQSLGLPNFPFHRLLAEPRASPLGLHDD
jgi:hypothetical protein